MEHVCLIGYIAWLEENRFPGVRLVFVRVEGQVVSRSGYIAWEYTWPGKALLSPTR